MKKRAFVLFVVTFAVFLGPLRAQVVFTENFDSYNVGTLQGQGTPPWTNLSSTGTNPPLQVSEPTTGNKVVAIPSGLGPDDYRFFPTQVTPVDGQSLTTRFDINVTAATNAGDLFAHISTSVLSPASPFYNRLYARAPTASPAGTFQLGLSAGNPIAGAVYGGDLTFGQHTVVSTWNFVTGAANDTFSMTVDGVPYIAAFAWNTLAVEPANIARFGLRQGDVNSPTIAAIDNIIITVVPEASSGLMAALGAGMLLLSFRRTRSIPARCS